MKTIMKFTVMMSLSLLTSVAMAKDPELSIQTNGKTKSLILSLDTQLNTTNLRILDGAQNVIYYEKIAETLYSKKFDLTNLEKGYYVLELDNSLKTLVYSIGVGSEVLEINKKTERSKPVFRKKGEKVFLNLLNLNTKDVELKVLDSQNRILYKEVIKGESLVEKAFNFENANEDRYTVLVKDDKNTYSESILVK